ncbi:DNA-binding protein [Lactiplantibacillus plantarum]|nr:DNA-binding protein [Lactiplantibacillus plantarum]MCG0914321.1 DNA-binding protein [Lactiplantibacillus plantarum]
MERIEAGMSVMTLKKQTYRVIAVINQGQELLVRAHEPETADIEIIPVTTVV